MSARRTETFRLLGAAVVACALLAAVPALAQGNDAFVDSSTGGTNEPMGLPNPFDTAITFRYDVVSADAHIQAGVYNAAGGLIRRLIPTADSRALPGGTTNRSITWNGNDDTGNSVTAGVAYTARFAAGLPAYASATIISPNGPQPAGLKDIDIDTGGNIYVVAEQSGSLVKYSANGSVIFNQKIPGAGAGQLYRPAGVAVSQRGAVWVYVADVDPADTRRARVTKFSAVDGSYGGSVLTSIGTASSGDPVGGLFYRNRGTQGDSLFLCRPGEREVYRLKIDTPTGNILSAQDLNISTTQWDNALDQPWDVTSDTDSDTNVYVALRRQGSLTNGDVMQYTWANFIASGTRTNELATSRNFTGVAWTRYQQCLASDYGENAVFRYPGNLAAATASFNNGAADGNGEDTPLNPWGICYNQSTDSIYVACYGTGHILVWQDSPATASDWTTTTAAGVWGIDPPAGALLQPSDIAVDDAGRIYVTNALGANVTIYSSDGTYLTEFGVPGEGAGELNRPFGVAVDTAGYVYVTTAMNEEATNPTLDDRIQIFEGYGAGHTLGTYTGKFSDANCGFRGLHFAPGSKVGTTTLDAELLAVGGGDENTAENESVFRFGTQEAWAAGASEGAITSADLGTDPLGDVTRDFSGRVYVNTYDLARLAPYVTNTLSQKRVYVLTSALAADTTLQTIGNGTTAGPGAIGGIAVNPYGDLFVSNMRDPDAPALGNSLIQTYHLTRIGGTSNGDSGGYPFSEFVPNGLGRPGALFYRTASSAGGIDKVFMVDFDSQVIRIFEVDYGEATTNLFDVDLVTVTRAADTPTVTAASISGSNVNTVSGAYYVRSGGPDTITVTFSENMNVADTPTVKLRDLLANEVTVTVASYSGNQYVGMVGALPGSLSDGRVRIVVQDAYGEEGGSGTATDTLSPNPTDDDTYSFFLDVTPPNVVHVTQPASPTSDAAINVSGNAEDNVGLYKIYLFNDTQTGFDPYDTVLSTNDAWTTSENWTLTALDLRASPSNNYVRAQAVDKALNASNFSDSPVTSFDGERRLVVRQALSSGNANVTPDRSYGLGERQRFVLKYVAQQALSTDSVAFTVPSGFSNPQTTSPTSSGYSTLGTDSSGFTGLVMKANIGDTRVVEVSFASAATAGWFTVVYGDSSTSDTGRVFINDGSLGGSPIPTLGATNFTAALFDDGNTSYAVAATVPAPPDLTIQVVGETMDVEVDDLFTPDTEVFPGEGDIGLARLRFHNRNVTTSEKDVRVVSITVRVIDTDSLTGVNANTVFSGLYCGTDTGTNKGYFGSVTGAAVPASPDATITLNSNDFNVDADGAPGPDPRDVYLTGVISGSGSGGYRIQVSAETSVVARVEVDGSNFTTTVQAYPGVETYPWRGDTANVYGLAAPDTIQVDSSSNANQTTSSGEDQVRIWNLLLVSPTAQRQITTTRLAFRVVNETGTGIVPSSVVQSVLLKDGDDGTSYLTDNSIEAAGETITLDPPTSPNPLNVGGQSADTTTVQVILKIAETAGDTRFRLRLVDTAAAVWRSYDRTPEPDVEVTNKRPADPRVFPFGSGLVTTQYKARVRVQGIRITSTGDVDIETVTQGQPFHVHVGLRADGGRADAMIVSSDTDVRFYAGRSAETEVTSEFTVQTRTHSTFTTLGAGAQDTIIYTVVQNAPYTGANDSLAVRVRTSATESMPLMVDANAYNNAHPVNRVPPILLVDADTATNYEEYASVSVVAVPDATPAAGADTIHVMRFRITDNSASDTLTGVQVVNTRTGTNAFYQRVRIFLDGDTDGAFDGPPTDPQFGATQTFSSETASFSGTRHLSGLGNTVTVFVLGDLIDTPVTDGETLDISLPDVGLTFFGRSPIPFPGLNSTGNVVVTITADRLRVTPETTSASSGASVQMTLEATDAYGNRDKYGALAGASVTATIGDSNRSADLTATTLVSPNPVPAAGDPRDSIVSGSLSGGVATITFTDTQGETVTVAASGSLPSDTSWVGFANNASASANARSSRGIAADSRNVVLLDVYVTNPGLDPPTADTITMVQVVSEGTVDTIARYVRLWVDENNNGAVDAGDSNVDTDVFAGGSVVFAISLSESAGRRLLIAADVDTRVRDGDSVGARIDAGGITLTVAGNLPTAGELDSISNDANNDSINVDCVEQSGAVRLTAPAEVATSANFTITVTAEDEFGNIDMINGAVRNASRDIDVTSTGNVVSFQSTSMTVVSGLPGTAPKLRVKSGSDTILAVCGTSGDVVVTANVLTSPPADTTVSIRFVGTEWEAVDYALPATQAVSGETDVVLSRQRLRNIGVTPDSAVAIRYRNVGNVKNGDLVNLRLYMDTDGSQTFSRAADSQVGTATTFNAAETAGFSFGWLFSSGETRTFFLVGDVESPVAAAEGETIDVEIAADSVTVLLSDDTVPLTTLNSSGYVAISRDVVVAAVPVTGATPAAGAAAVEVLRFRIQDNAGADTVGRIQIQNAYPATDTEIAAVAVYIDADRDGTYDTGGDPQFGAVGDFKTSDTATFLGSRAMSGSGDTATVFVLVTLETYPVTDGDTIDLALPASGLTMTDSLAYPSTETNSTGNVVATIIGAALSVSPDTRTTAANIEASMTLEAVDAYANRDRYAHASNEPVRVMIDTYNAGIWDITATTLTAPTPADLSGTADTVLTGNLASGQAVVTFKGNAECTRPFQVHDIGGSGLAADTSWIVISPLASASDNARSGRPLRPDSRDVVILDFTVRNPSVSDTIDSVVLVAEVTAETEIRWIRLWFDADSSGTIGAGDTALDTAVFSGGYARLLEDAGESRVIGTAARRFLIAVDIETRVTDGHRVGVQIDTGGILLASGETVPRSGYPLDSIDDDALDDTIDVAATDSGCVLHIVGPETAGVCGDPAAITITVHDTFGNVDTTATFMKTDASYNVVFNAAPANACSFTTTSMTKVAGLGGPTFTGRLNRLGRDTLAFFPMIDGAVTLTADIITSPPSDTTFAFTSVATADTVNTESSSINATMAVADGADTSLVQILITDMAGGCTPLGLPRMNDTVVLVSSKGAGDVITAIDSTTNETGIATFWVSSADSTPSYLTAIVSGITLAESGTITWVPSGQAGFEHRIGFDSTLAILMGEAAATSGDFLLFPTFSEDGQGVAWLAKRNEDIDTWAIYTSFDDGAHGDGAADDGVFSSPVRVTGTGHYLYPNSRPTFGDVLDAAGDRGSDGVVDVVFSGRNDGNPDSAGTATFDIMVVRSDGSDAARTKANTRLISDTSGPWAGVKSDPAFLPGTDTIVFVSSGKPYIINGRNPRLSLKGPLTSPVNWGVFFTQPVPFDQNTVAFIGRVAADASRSRLFVFRNFAQAGLTSYCTGCGGGGLPYVVSYDDANFKWNLSWDSAGEVLSYAEDVTGNFSYSTLLANPNTPHVAFATSDFDIRMRRWNGTGFASDSVNLIPSGSGRDDVGYAFAPAGPARALRISQSSGGDSVELRVLSIDGEAEVDQTGGVVYDNSRLTVVVDEGDVQSGSFQLRIDEPAAPPASPGGSDSIVLTGAARQFFPEGQQFADSITIRLYYDAADLAAAGIANNSVDEYRMRAFFWNGSSWEDYGGVVYPTDGNGALGYIQFVTTHFSIFAPGFQRTRPFGDLEVTGPSVLFEGETAVYTLRAVSSLVDSGIVTQMTVRVGDSTAVVALVGDTALWVVTATETGLRYISAESFAGMETVLFLPSPIADSSLPAAAAASAFGASNRISLGETSFTLMAYLPGVTDTAGATLMGADGASYGTPAETQGAGVFVWYDVPLSSLGETLQAGETSTLRITAPAYTGDTARLEFGVLLYPDAAPASTETFATPAAGVSVEIPAGGAADTPFLVFLSDEDTTGGLPAGYALLGEAVGLEARTITGEAVGTETAPFETSVWLLFDVPERHEGAIADVRVGRLDGGTWTVLSTSAETAARRVLSLRDHLSAYTLLLYGQAVATDLANAVVYPNPWRADAPTAGLGPSDVRYGLKIDGLTAEVTVTIFNTAGERVLEGRINTTTGVSTSPHLRRVENGVVSWDLRNPSDRDVASGVYVVQISDGARRVVRKAAVIR